LACGRLTAPTGARFEVWDIKRSRQEIGERGAMDPGAPLAPAFIPLLDGLAIGLGLILAIGPQGLFVLRQGLARQHLHLVCLLCSLTPRRSPSASPAPCC
jgi:hypothetical protein